MATYYVSRYGSDSNNGLGPDPTHATNKPWLTIGKAMGASGMASGDTLQIAPGIYRDAVTVAMTSPTAETLIQGDIWNASGFCDTAGVRLAGGSVEIKPYVHDSALGRKSGAAFALQGRDYFTFQDLVVYGHASLGGFNCGTDATHLTWRRVVCFANTENNSGVILGTASFGTPLAWRFEHCVFLGGRSPAYIQVVGTLGTGADWDVDVVCAGCYSERGLCRINVTGSGANKPGGVTIYNCTLLDGEPLYTQYFTYADGWSTNLPAACYNSLLNQHGTGSAVTAVTLGQVVENWNYLLCSGARANVTAGASSVSASTVNGEAAAPWQFPEPGRQAAGRRNRQLFALQHNVPMMGFGGQAGGPTTDLFGLPRPCGTMIYGDRGTATSGAVGTLTLGTDQIDDWTFPFTVALTENRADKVLTVDATVGTVTEAGVATVTVALTSEQTTALGVGTFYWDQWRLIDGDQERLLAKGLLRVLANARVPVEA